MYIRLILLILIILSSISCITLPKEFVLDPEVTAVKRDIPDLDGYVTIKADLHLHTIFSDGKVTYKDRINEAYREGIDLIAITDHNHYRYAPTKTIINLLRDRLWESALEYAEEKNIILIKGIELTRASPPGHFCAIFLEDVTKFNHINIMGNMREAKAQNAFVFWNHLYNYDRYADGTYWWPIHAEMLEEGLLHGIELNGSSQDEAFTLCLEKNMTIIGTTDRHRAFPVFNDGEHRRMTLIFARDRTPEAIYEALMERRTAFYNNNRIHGEEIYLKELFEKAVNINIRRTSNTAIFSFKNNSDLIFNMSINNAGEDAQETFTIDPQSEIDFTVGLNDIKNGQIVFYINNFFTGPDKVMEYPVRL